MSIRWLDGPPIVPQRTVRFEPEQREKKSPFLTASDPILSAATLGIPIIVPLGAPPPLDVAGIPRAAPLDRDWYLVHLACSFHPAEGEAFVAGRLRVSLQRQDRAVVDRPVAWSLHPARSSAAYSVSERLGMKATAKAGVLGWGVTGERTESFTEEEIAIEATGELGNEAVWEFFRTKASPVRGDYRLALVVASPRGLRGTGEVSLSADIQRHHFQVFSYTGRLPEEMPIRFLMP